MPDSTDQKYTVAFVFSSDLSQVLLIHKESPDWQKGYVNGIGGKYNPGETAQQCIRRETLEESGLDIPEEQWIYIGTIKQPIGAVGVLSSVYRGKIEDAEQRAHEKLEWFDYNHLPSNIIQNLSWLVPLAHTKLTDGEVHSTYTEFIINYP